MKRAKRFERPGDKELKLLFARFLLHDRTMTGRCERTGSYIGGDRRTGSANGQRRGPPAKNDLKSDRWDLAERGGFEPPVRV